MTDYAKLVIFSKDEIVNMDAYFEGRIYVELSPKNLLKETDPIFYLKEIVQHFDYQPNYIYEVNHSDEGQLMMCGMSDKADYIFNVSTKKHINSARRFHEQIQLWANVYVAIEATIQRHAYFSSCMKRCGDASLKLVINAAATNLKISNESIEKVKEAMRAKFHREVVLYPIY